MAPNPFTTSQDAHRALEIAFRRLAPSVARVVADTAGAFLAQSAVPGPEWSLLSRLPDLGLLQCSQRNVGERHEMICNLAVEKSEWRQLLGSGACDDEDISLDAFCEMANCICGSLLADAGFLDEFGYLIPCVPYAGHFRPMAGARTLRGAVLLGGVRVHYAITVQTTVGAMTGERMLAA